MMGRGIRLPPKDLAMNADYSTVRSVMTANPVSIAPDAPLNEALDSFARYPFRHLPVVDAGGAVLGMVTDKELFISATTANAEPAGGDGAGVELAMTPVPKLSPAESVTVALRTMCERRIDALPVVDQGKLVGIVTSTDLLNRYVDLCLQRPDCDDQVIRHMHRNFCTVSPEATLEEALEMLDESHPHALVALGGEPEGLVSESDLRAGLALQMMREPAGDLLLVRDVMPPEFRRVEPSSRLARAALAMAADELPSLAVIHGGQVFGLIGWLDVLRHFQEVADVEPPAREAAGS